MDTQQVKAQADRFIELLHRIEEGDLDSIDHMVEMFSEDAELTNPIIEREGRPRTGREQVADFWKMYRDGFTSIHSNFSDVTISEHSAGLFWRSTGKHASGSPLDYEGVSLLQFDNAGKIARFKGYFDTSQVVTKAHA